MFYNKRMRQVWNTLTCLQCKEKIIQVSDTILNPNIDSKIKQKILDDTWMNTICPRCGALIRSIAPCIYKDHEKKLLIHVKRKFDVQESGYHQRFVSTKEAFRELILIYELGLDDQQIMYIRKILKKRHQKVFFIHGDDEILVFECDGEIKMVKNPAQKLPDRGECITYEI